MSQSQKLWESTRDVPLAKSLSYLLQHSEMRDVEGYVNISRLLALPQFRHVSIHDILRVVKNDGKQRFRVENKDDVRKAKIRIDKEVRFLKPIDSAVHGECSEHTLFNPYHTASV